MNERIKELAEQAHCYACEYARRPDYSPHNPYNESMYKRRYDSKFAELIVRECAELSVNSQYANTKSEYYEGFNEALVYAGNKIRKHFGVEE